jgi:hypothetical protein
MRFAATSMRGESAERSGGPYTSETEIAWTAGVRG